MARKHQAKTAAAAAGQSAISLLSLLLLTAAAKPQDAATPPVPAPFARDCQTASGPSMSPLPNVAAALRQRKPIKILAIGATPSLGRLSQGQYTGQIEQILEQAVKGLDAVVINRGVSGELAADAARRIKVEVALTDPNLVLWQVGTNDALAYVPLDELRTTIVDTIRWLRAHHVDVLLAGLQSVSRMERDQQYRAVRELIRSIGEQEKVVVVRTREARQLIARAAENGGGLLPEEFAPTELGYACLAEYVARAMTVGTFGRALRERSSTTRLPSGAPAGPAQSQP